jgi:Arc/MetJ-type ribon-helix-helix transcriptional regulator
MSINTDTQDVSLSLPPHVLSQLDELVRTGYFKDRQTAVTTAVERLYAEKQPHMTARQAAFARLKGALHLGTTRESRQRAKLDRLEWEGKAE